MQATGWVGLRLAQSISTLGGIQGTMQVPLLISKLYVWDDKPYDGSVASVISILLLCYHIISCLFGYRVQSQGTQDHGTILLSPCILSALLCRCRHKSEPKSQ